MRHSTAVCRRLAGSVLRWLSGRSGGLSDPALEVLIERRDERLLADAGLTLDAAMGPARYFREKEMAEIDRTRPRW